MSAFDVDEELGEKTTVEPPLAEPSSPLASPIQKTTTQRIAWKDDDDRPARGRAQTIGGTSLRRSASRDSIRSVQSRTQAQSTVPIEFRTLSFRVADSHARSEGGEKRRSPSPQSLKRFQTVTQFEQTEYHKLSVDEVCRRLRVSIKQGLSNDAAQKRLQEDGRNVFPRQRVNYAKKLLGYVFGGFCSILWIGVIIFFICWRPLGDPDPAPYNLGLAILILIVIFLQACFSAFQDWSTAKTMNSILDMMPSEAHVLREGAYQKILTADIVAGDIVRINIGDKVPADLRLMEISGDVRFDRSALTGESEEVDGTIDCTNENFLESQNIALMGTMVTNGSATGVIVYTGTKTVMGGIANATSNVKEKPTLIQREISRFVKIICVLTAFLASLILITWAAWLRVDHFQFMNVVAMLNNVMGCVVAFIPEGMPIAVALTLLLIAHRMKSAHVLPKSLATVEMLGCVNVICSDKTGTLTENKMTVTSVGFVDGLLNSEEAKEKYTAEKAPSKSLEELYHAAHLCNDATFDPLTLKNPIEDRLTQGNPTDGAILRFAETGTEGATVKHSFPLVAKLPFNSKYKLMVTLHMTSTNEDPPYVAFVKGAPDILLPKCTSYWSYQSNEVKPLDEEALRKMEELQTHLSSNAERVILLCQRKYTPEAELGSSEISTELAEQCVSELTIIGVLGIFDPPRAESAATVASCRRAGIRFFMMTGDFGLTGAAIARQIGIFSTKGQPDTFATIKEGSKSDETDESGPLIHSSLLLEGSQINELQQDDWDIVCKYEEVVFGRCVPEHKLRIIDELKQRGFATAVTGDGVNDAPALKAADVGIAMVNGSDVALEAADLVLLSGFDSIVDGIRLGRLVFQNLQKVISYLLPAGSWSEIWPVLINVYFGVPLPLSSFLMIIICVFTDLFLSLSLIMEKEEFDLLSLPPRKHKKDHLINFKIYAQSYLFIGLMETTIAHAMYFLYYWRYAGIPISSLWFAFEAYGDGFYGYTQDELTSFNTVGQSVYFVTLVILQWGNILSIRNKRLSILQADPVREQRRNPWLVASAIISLAIAIFVTEVPGIQSLFGTASVPLEFWFLPLPLAFAILIMDEIRKLIVRVRPKGLLARLAW